MNASKLDHNVLLQYVLRLGDDSFFLGHQLSLYCSHGPFLEEDLAISNTALDLLGQAEAFYKYAATLTENAVLADDLVYNRLEHQFVNVHLVEMPNVDFASINVRQFFMDNYFFHLYSELTSSSDEQIAAIANKSLVEVTYHLRRSSEWMVRLGQGTELSKQRLIAAIELLWPYTRGLFQRDDVTSALSEQGIAATMAKVKTGWDKRTEDIFKMADVSIDFDSQRVDTGRKGIHTEHMGRLLNDIQFLSRTYPDSTWY